MKASTLSVLAILVLVAFVVFGDRSVCPAAGLLGIPCPSCGLSRATLALLSGDWRRAQGIHPLVVPVLAYLATVGWITLRRSGWSRAPRLSMLVVVGVLLVVAMTLVWLARFWGLFGGPVDVRAWRF